MFTTHLRPTSAAGPRNHKRLAFRQRGQALVLGIFLILVGATMAIVLYTTGQTATEKSRLVNAADAAAYSGGVFIARNLNFMAYTNRAMIANHVAVGHFVSYMSFTRYVDDSADNLALVTSWIPVVNAITRAIAQGAEYVKLATEYFGTAYVPISEGMNQVLRASQFAAKVAIALPGADVLNGAFEFPLLKTMNGAAKSYDDTIRVNDPEDMGSLTGVISAARIALEFTELFNFTTLYDAGDDDGRIKELIDSSLGPSETWITDRDWRFTVFPVRFRKRGDTDHSIDGDGADWKADDRQVFQTFSFSRLKFKTRATIGKGKASATEFLDSYSGVPQYTDISEDFRGKNTILNVTALASMPVSQTRPAGILGIESTTPRMAALARAEIEHERPDDENLFARVGEGEFSNVFNPFWEARLTPLESVGFTVF